MSPDSYDLVVIGGGIYGACILRDAALRGLSAVLLERNDFGCETSHNSNKIIHSGIRYLQQMDIPRVLECILETRNWMRIAPHLVEPLPFVVPDYRLGLRGKEVMALGIKTHDLMKRLAGCDLPAGGVLSRAETLRWFPMIESACLRGAAYWYDGQLQDANQLVYEIIEDAKVHGAVAHNYVNVDGLLWRQGAVGGVTARCRATGDEFTVRSRIVVNAAGPWLNELLPQHVRPSYQFDRHYMGMNLVIDQAAPKAGLAMYGPGQGAEAAERRLYFLTPWNGHAIVGTSHVFRTGSPDAIEYTAQDVHELIRGAKQAFPFLDLCREKVLYVYQGLTPAAADRERLTRSRQFSIVDHQRADNIPGLVSVMGVKLTSARYIAERVLNLVESKVGRAPVPCETARRVLPRTPSCQQRQHVSPRVELLAKAGDERILRLQDLVTCRTNFAERGLVNVDDLEACAHAMGARLNWSPERREAEVAAARKRLRL